MKKDFNLFITEEYDARKSDIYKLIKNGMLFKLTGADEITFNFHKDDSFILSFKNRGNIFGTFLEIIPNTRVNLLWNVNGFGRDEETNTRVQITLVRIDGRVQLELNHTGIRDKLSFNAKQKAWSKILKEMEKELFANFEQQVK